MMPSAPLPQLPTLFLAALLGTNLACTVGPARSNTSPLQILGVIEGFYGEPWSHENRLDLIEFMGRVGLRDYVYAPKDDPYHLRRWREPYPETELEQLRELAATSAAHGIQLWYAISPGLSMQYSSDDDYGILMQKIQSVAAVGVSHFGLFMDDVSAQLSNDEDRAAYGTLAAAHIELTNRLAADLAALGHELLFTPTTYTNAWGDRQYARDVGAGIDPDVPLVWTGMDVASPVITANHATEWGSLIGRRPVLWDNYPVNDYAPWRVFLGPVTGRAPDLATSLTGIIANPMNQVHASMLPLHTLATYVRDPVAYDPEAAHQAAIEDLFGDHARYVGPLLRAFGDNGWDDNVFEPLYFLRDTIALGSIAAVITDATAALDSLKNSDDPFVVAFAEEIEPILRGLLNRTETLQRNPLYRQDGTNLYYIGDDAYDAVEHTPTVDGRLDDWGNVPAHPVHGPVAAQVRFATDGTSLFVGIEVTSARGAIRSGNHLPEGDHVEIIQQRDPGDRLDAEDRVLLIAAPPDRGRGAALIRSLRIDGFMAKWLQDNAGLTFNEFHMTNMADVHPDEGRIRWAAGPTRRGYAVEVALPVTGAEESLAIQISDRSAGRRQVSALSRRNFPMNPRTFVRVGTRPIR